MFALSHLIVALNLLLQSLTTKEDIYGMKQRLKNLIKYIPLVSRILFGVSRKLDYKTLSRYLIRINEQKGLAEILQEASQCLKDILNYRLFAFAIQDKEQLDVWIDPKVYKQPVCKIIEQDFNVRGSGSLNFHHLGSHRILARNVHDCRKCCLRLLCHWSHFDKW